jgi:hypothetical protein
MHASAEKPSGVGKDGAAYPFSPTAEKGGQTDEGRDPRL